MTVDAAGEPGSCRDGYPSPVNNRGWTREIRLLQFLHPVFARLPCLLSSEQVIDRSNKRGQLPLSRGEKLRHRTSAAPFLIAMPQSSSFRPCIRRLGSAIQSTSTTTLSTC